MLLDVGMFSVGVRNNIDKHVVSKLEARCGMSTEMSTEPSRESRMNGRSRTPRQTSSKTSPRVVAPPPSADPCESSVVGDSAAEPRSEEFRRLRRRVAEQQDVVDKLAHETGRLQKSTHAKGRKIGYLAKKSSENQKMKVQGEMFRQAQDSVSFLKNYRSRRNNSVYFNLSRRGGCRLAIKRNQGHVGSEALAQRLEVRMSRQTVNGWERILAATVLEMSSDFYNCHYDSLSRLKCGGPLLLTYKVNGVRCDATNSIMLRHKAHVCEMSTVFSHLEGGQNILRLATGSQTLHS